MSNAFEVVPEGTFGCQACVRRQTADTEMRLELTAMADRVLAIAQRLSARDTFTQPR